MPGKGPLDVTVKYSEGAGCRGVNTDIDRSIIMRTELAVGVNARVKSGTVVCRGGQSKRNASAMDGKVYGLIDTEGEFDTDWSGTGSVSGDVTGLGAMVVGDTFLGVEVVASTTPGDPTPPYTYSYRIPGYVATPSGAGTYFINHLPPDHYYVTGVLSYLRAGVLQREFRGGEVDIVAGGAVTLDIQFTII